MRGNESPPRWAGLLDRLPVTAAVALVPLVVYLRVEPLSGDRFDFWNGQRANYDFFSYYKARLVVAFGALALAGLIAGFARRASALRRLPVAARALLGLYALLAVVSAWASPFPAVALNGFPDRYEGLPVLLSYVVLLLASFTALSTPARAWRTAAWLTASSAVVAIIGLFQYAGLDPLRTALGRALILPADYDPVAPALMFAAEARAIYSTLYHYNYVGSYAALVLPFAVGLLWAGVVPGRARWPVAASAALVSLVWVLCASRGGLFGGVLALAALALAQRSRLRLRWRTLAPAAAALVVMVALADMAIGGRILERAGQLASDITRMLAAAPARAPAPPLELAAISGAAVRLRTPEGLVELRHETGTLSAQDVDSRPLPLVAVSPAGRFRIDDPRFDDLVCTVGRIGGAPALVVQREAYILNFLLLDSGIRLALKTGRAVPHERVDSFGFEGREAIGSARGYIWSRSLPLLRRTLLLGFGPDTFAFVFPQQDFTGKFRVYGTTDMLVDKAHNLFLQSALNTGVASALALAVLLGWYLAACVRLYLRRVSQGPYPGVGAACFAGVVGYLGAAMFNDSVVCVAPVFWVVLGLGLRMNVECAAPSRPAAS